MTVLGMGAYGQVFLAVFPHRRRCAVKVFSGRRYNEEAASEQSVYEMLDGKLAPSMQGWHPAFLQAEPHAEPWPRLFRGRTLSAKLVNHVLQLAWTGARNRSN